MMQRKTTAILVLAMMLTSGCLGAVDDIEDELDRTIQIIVEDYPQLDLQRELEPNQLCRHMTNVMHYCWISRILFSMRC